MQKSHALQFSESLRMELACRHKSIYVVTRQTAVANASNL